MSYLTSRDYRKTIQDAVLSQILGTDTTIQPAAEFEAIEELSTYLRQKYDLAQEFTPTNIWSNAFVYKAADRVVLDYPAYNPSITYAINDYATINSNAYRCTTAITTPEPFNASKWSLLGAQYDIYYGAFPQNPFQFGKFYNTGDKVFWKGKVYTALQPTPVLSTEDAIQYGTLNNIPAQNVFPDDTTNGPSFWGTGTAYTIAAATALSDTTKWTKGDNRNAMVIMYLVDMALYHIHSRISPRNIPEVRIQRYHSAIEWLREAAKGTVTANLVVIQPKQGGRIRHGGNVKRNNNY